MARYRVEVDRTACQGFGACVELCPSSFYLSEADGKTKIRGAREAVEEGENVREEVDEGENVREVIEVDDLGCLGQAAEACPFKAIMVVGV